MAEFDRIFGCNLGKPRCSDAAGLTTSPSPTSKTLARRARTNALLASLQRGGVRCAPVPSRRLARKASQVRRAAQHQRDPWPSLRGQCALIRCRAQIRTRCRPPPRSIRHRSENSTGSRWEDCMRSTKRKSPCEGITLVVQRSWIVESRQITRDSTRYAATTIPR